MKRRVRTLYRLSELQGHTVMGWLVLEFSQYMPKIATWG